MLVSTIVERTASAELTCEPSLACSHSFSANEYVGLALDAVEMH